MTAERSKHSAPRRHGLGNYTEACAVRIQHEPVPQLHPASGIQLHASLNLFLVQPRDVESGIAACIELASQDSFIVPTGDKQLFARRQIAVDAQATKERGTVKGATPPDLEDTTRSPEAMRRGNISKRRSGIGDEQSGAAPGPSPADPLTLQQNRIETSQGARIRGRAAGQAAADNDDVRAAIAAIPWKSRDAGAWKLVNPW